VQRIPGEVGVFITVHITFPHESYREKIENRFTFCESMAKRQVSCYFLTHSVYRNTIVERICGTDGF